MRVSFHLLERSAHQMLWGKALRAGMQRHGVNVSTGAYNVAGNADIAVVWTWRQLNLIRDMQSSGRKVLVMERGHIQPRRDWCSLAVDGLNGRGKYPPPGNNSRFRKHFAHHLRPWRRKDGPVLLVGQVEGDAALHGLDMEQWARKTAAALLRQGRQVIWRPHPRSRHTSFCPYGVERSHSSLEDDLGRCSVVVVWSSTTAVESVLAGVPTITLDKGAMAWPVAGHDLAGEPPAPDRRRWCREMAWRQWSLEEFENGDAWAHFRPLLEGR